MLDSAHYRELRNDKMYDKHAECEMSVNGSIGENLTGNSWENV